jgi:hypothetical protein
MTAKTSIDPSLFLHEQLAQASPDLMRELLGTFINALLMLDSCASPTPITRMLAGIRAAPGAGPRNL